MILTIGGIMKKTVSTLSTAALCLALVSCGDDDPIQEALNEGDEQTTQFIMMQEDWVSACMESNLLNTSIQKTFSFNEDEFSEKVAIFSDSSCSSNEGEIAMRGDFDVEGGDEIKDLNLNYKNVTVKPNSDIAVDILSAVNFCDVDNWQKGQEIKVAGENLDNCIISSVPELRYGKVEVDDSEDSLYLSSEFSLSPEDRPQRVDYEVVYRDQD